LLRSIAITHIVRDFSCAQQSLSQKSKIFDSSLYTREPRKARTELFDKSEFDCRRSDTGQKESGSDTRNPGAHCQRRLAAKSEFDLQEGKSPTASAR